jgi:tRNA A37 methylthiotransferase MiaB
VLIGLPGETQKEFQETVDLCIKTKPDSVALSIYEPYPGTSLYSQAVLSGLMKDTPAEEFGRTQATFDYPQFSRNEIQKEFELFNEKIGVDPLIGHLSFFMNAGVNVDKYVPAYRSYYKKAYTNTLLPVW